MDFVAIDFKTTNEKRASVCYLGITVVKNNKITNAYESVESIKKELKITD